MKYNQVWYAVDKLAEMNNLSPSGLAKKAGLDSTTFNKSKRIRPDGKKRWPSMESISKILTVCNCDFQDFYKLGTSEETNITNKSTPFCTMSEIASEHKIDENGIINIDKWSKINFPEIESGYIAIEVDNDNFKPFYSDGDILIVNTKCEIRKTDKVIVKDKYGNINIFEFLRRTPDSVEFKSIINDEKTSIKLFNIEWIKRIIWASQ